MSNGIDEYETIVYHWSHPKRSQILIVEAEKDILIRGHTPYALRF